MRKLALGCGAMLLAVTVLLAVVDRFCDPSGRLQRLKPGMSETEVIRQIPARLIRAQLHSLEHSRFSSARDQAEQMGLVPVYLVVLGECLWPLAPATVCYLYFDADRKLIGSYKSQS